MRHDELYVADLVDSTRAVREYLDGISRERWDQDRVLRDAVLYRLMLLGEIASALPEALRDRYPDVAWRQIRAFRNLAVHKYFSVDWAVVWQISREEVPVLEEQAMDIMRAEFPELAKTYEPETAVKSGQDETAGALAQVGVIGGLYLPPAAAGFSGISNLAENCVIRRQGSPQRPAADDRSPRGPRRPAHRSCGRGPTGPSRRHTSLSAVPRYGP